MQRIAICFCKARRALRWEARQQREESRSGWAARMVEADPCLDALSGTSTERLSEVVTDMPPEILYR